MESDIKVKCTFEEMEQFFENGDNISVRYYEQIAPELFQCKIRHKELKKRLSGTFSINQLKNKFNEK